MGKNTEEQRRQMDEIHRYIFDYMEETTECFLEDSP
jgi:hypothetical protein